MKQTDPVSALVAINPNLIPVAVLVQAVTEREEEQRKSAVATAKARLESIDHDIHTAVEELRRLRAIEATQTRKVRGYAAAKAQFLKDGDYVAYGKARNTVNLER